jgi:hypothetical protein
MTTGLDNPRAAAIPRPRTSEPRVEAWDAALRFLLIDNRALALARSHPLAPDGRCRRCGTSCCAAANLAVEALAVLAGRR